MKLSTNHKVLAAALLLIVLYGVGILGISDPPRRMDFLLLTPINLLITTGILLVFHRHWTPIFVISIVLVMLCGFAVEVAGVQTGKIFGVYHYGKTLGWKCCHVPLIIGVNWFLLIYCTTAALKPVKNIFVFATAGALLMVALDLLLEPVAMRLDFWQWQSDKIPLQNYLAWFAVSWILLFFFRKFNPATENKLSAIVLVIQFIFFGLLNLIFNI